ncbi:biotin/lipoyl-containing protein, partial [Curtobacterium sp. MCLR17_039]|uniref:biotin/lipoyl-containing protein n=1 Tax=Curtobacterium sp. MCLR17_039 TaxID=2175624 RepID=UPI002814AF20
MSESVNLPALGESVTEGTVTRWLKNVGDRVEVDEPLLEVSTDKVDTEIPSPIAGVVEEILVQEDETVEVGTALVKIGDGSGSSDGGSDSSDSGADDANAAAADAEEPEAAPSTEQEAETPAPEPTEPEPGDLVEHHLRDREVEHRDAVEGVDGAPHARLLRFGLDPSYRCTRANRTERVHGRGSSSTH